MSSEMRYHPEALYDLGRHDDELASVLKSVYEIAEKCVHDLAAACRVEQGDHGVAVNADEHQEAELRDYFLKTWHEQLKPTLTACQDWWGKHSTASSEAGRITDEIDELLSRMRHSRSE